MAVLVPEKFSHSLLTMLPERFVSLNSARDMGEIATNSRRMRFL